MVRLSVGGPTQKVVKGNAPGHTHVERACFSLHGDGGMEVALRPTVHRDAPLLIAEHEAGGIRCLAIEEVHVGLLTESDSLEAALSQIAERFGRVGNPGYREPEQGA